MIKIALRTAFLIAMSSTAFVKNAFSQASVEPWGNMEGIRVEGELFEFETSLRVVGADWSQIRQSAKEVQDPRYQREGKKQIINSNLDSVYFREVVEDTDIGMANVTVQFTAKADTNITGAFFCVTVPQQPYKNSTIKIAGHENISFTNIRAAQAPLSLSTKDILIEAADRQLRVQTDEPTKVFIRKNNQQQLDVYFLVLAGKLAIGQSAEKTFSLKATGKVDKSPVALTLDPLKLGRPFDGLGGNFRLQNPQTDPQVIEYSLKHLNVRWGRVEMPWRFWQGEESTDPLAAAKTGPLHPRVEAAMKMAQELDKKGIPVILSNWSAPDWAIKGPFHNRPVNGVWGNPLNEEKMDKIYQSIADYIQYMKENYGVEATFFSFNESDLGINVRQTPEEHAQLIKGLGAYLESRGLKTKLLLGDNSDANTFDFIKVAMNDPEALPYIGAISFHSWRGWADTTLTKWANAAKELNRPLIVGEGSIDAAAWRYPEIFEEPIYAMEEINLYIRILAICQPLSILQWQLTADYSPLAGGGIFGNQEPLRPTRRFWNLKQLSTTPENSRVIAINSDKENVTCAALRQTEKGIYTIHLVNNGPTRTTTITGLPREVKGLQLFVTDGTRENEKEQMIPVSKGKAHFTLNKVSYVTLISQ